MKSAEQYLSHFDYRTLEQPVESVAKVWIDAMFERNQGKYGIVEAWSKFGGHVVPESSTLSRGSAQIIRVIRG